MKMYNGMYNSYNQQINLDRINNQIKELENMRNQYQGMVQQQMPSNTGITQNFQLAPNNQSSKINYCENIEDVRKELVFADTLFINKECSQLWLKNASGDIKTYELKEIVILDEKDLKIAQLEAKINMLENGGVNSESNVNVNENVNGKSTIKKSASIQSNK